MNQTNYEEMLAKALNDANRLGQACAYRDIYMQILTYQESAVPEGLHNYALKQLSRMHAEAAYTSSSCRKCWRGIPEHFLSEMIICTNCNAKPVK